MGFDVCPSDNQHWFYRTSAIKWYFPAWKLLNQSFHCSTIAKNNFFYSILPIWIPLHSIPAMPTPKTHQKCVFTPLCRRILDVSSLTEVCIPGKTATSTTQVHSSLRGWSILISRPRRLCYHTEHQIANVFENVRPSDCRQRAADTDWPISAGLLHIRAAGLLDGLGPR